ncbi:MAG: fibronectin type III domain-containing protein [Actinobacteria bacterium]|nr:fibronectin type III domain-containing protein [Actinomycetota bacterium]
MCWLTELACRRNRRTCGTTSRVPYHHGTSDPSPVSDPYTPWTPVAPGAPVNVVASARPAQVDLDWDAPESDGGEPITDYVIEYSTDSGSSWTHVVRAMSSRSLHRPSSTG